MIAIEQTFWLAKNLRIPLHHLKMECKQRLVTKIVTQLHCRIYTTWASEGVNKFHVFGFYLENNCKHKLPYIDFNVKQWLNKKQKEVLSNYVPLLDSLTMCVCLYK